MQSITVDDVFKGVVLVAAVVAAVDQLHRRLRRWLSHAWEQQLVSVKEDIAEIRKELTTNGGRSLKDEVIGIRRDMDDRHRQNSVRFDGVEARLEEVERELVRAQRDQRRLVRAITTHLRLGHREAHTESPAQGIPDEVIDGLEALSDMERNDDRRGRRGKGGD